MQMDPCLENYDSDQDAAFGSAAAAGPQSGRLNHTLLHQEAAASMPADDRQHSPDSSATLTGSGPCSDASDLTSSHPSDLPKHHHKRIKLGSTQSAQQESVRHASAQYAPDPNALPLGSVGAASAQLRDQAGVQLPELSCFGTGQAGADTEVHRCNVLFQPALSPPDRLQAGPGHPARCPQQDPPLSTHAPHYVPCVIPGLAPSHQLIKEQEEKELAQALRRQQNVYSAGYEMDALGAVRLPFGQYKRMISMKVVFAQRWQQKAQAAAMANAAHLSMKQLLLDEAVQLEVEQAPSGGQGSEDRLQQGALQMPMHPEQVYKAPAKLPVRLSNLKNAMRKAELSGPELSTSTASGNLGSSAVDANHIAWQVEQLRNTSLLNDTWVEYYIDRFNLEFDTSYWSMLEHLSAGSQ